jgi:hypothetical protein
MNRVGHKITELLSELKHISTAIPSISCAAEMLTNRVLQHWAITNAVCHQGSAAAFFSSSLPPSSFSSSFSAFGFLGLTVSFFLGLGGVGRVGLWWVGGLGTSGLAFFLDPFFLFLARAGSEVGWGASSTKDGGIGGGTLLSFLAGPDQGGLVEHHLKRVVGLSLFLLFDGFRELAIGSAGVGAGVGTEGVIGLAFLLLAIGGLFGLSRGGENYGTGNLFWFCQVVLWKCTRKASTSASAGTP